VARVWLFDPNIKEVVMDGGGVKLRPGELHEESVS
jgi:hypothetical protein